MLIFDPIRKKQVAATPEEQVRQQFVRYLLSQKNVPSSLIAIEQQLTINNLQRRCDVVVFDKNGQPLLLAECKAPNVALTNNVFEQAACYNIALRTPYLVITNGNITYCCRVEFETQEIKPLTEMPDYEEMKNINS